MKNRIISALLLTSICAALMACNQTDEPIAPAAVEIASVSMVAGDSLDLYCNSDFAEVTQVLTHVVVSCLAGALPTETATEVVVVLPSATDTPQSTDTATFTPTLEATPTGTWTPAPVDTATLTPTWTATITPTNSVTVTPVPPTATNTAMLTQTNTQTNTQTKLPTVAPPAGTPSALTPLCATHDPTKWHGLYDSALNCRHTHHHGDNPSDPLQCDPLLAQWFGALPTQISYEWQTLGENTLKHDGYVKMCRLFAGPGSGNALANDLNWVGRTGNAVVGVYGDFHRHAGKMDRERPEHSYRLWIYSCRIVAGVIDWTQCGTFKTGGHAHMGIFMCLYKEKHCARPNDPKPILTWIPGVGMDTSGLSIDPYIAVNKNISETLRLLNGLPEAWSTSGTLRWDSNHDVWDLWTTGPGIYSDTSTITLLPGMVSTSATRDLLRERGYNWNAGFAILSTDDPDSVNITAYNASIAAGKNVTDSYAVLNTSICQFAPVGKFCRFDGSEHGIFTAYAQVPAWWDGAKYVINGQTIWFDTDQSVNGYVSADTYTDLRGNPKPACTTASAACVPLILNRSPVGWSGWNAAVSEWKNGKMPGNLREYNPYNFPINHH